MSFLDQVDLSQLTGISSLWEHVVAGLNTKVDTEDGKGLSTEDYTTADKELLANLKTLVGDVAVSDRVSRAIAAMVDSAPETLNTLNELAAALGDDPNFAATIATQIGLLETKVGDSTVSEQVNEIVDAAIAAIPVPDVSGQINTHNTSSTAHSDIRAVVDQKSDKLTNIIEGNPVAIDPGVGSMLNVTTDGTTVIHCGKNLLPYPYKNTTITTNGITFTDNGDGSITINGTATGTAFFNLSAIDFLVGTNFSTNTYHTTNGEYVFNFTDSYVSGLTAIYTGETGKHPYLRVGSGTTINNLTVYPMVELGSVKTDWEPYKSESFDVQDGKISIPAFDGVNTLRTEGTNMSVMYSVKNDVWTEIDNRIEEAVEDSVGILSVKQTTTSTADSGSNIVTVTLTDGTTSTFTVMNGSKGSGGADGTSVTVQSVNESTADGGSNVITFSNGKTVTIKNGSKGSTGDIGPMGMQGIPGNNGYSPVRGIDYWTTEDLEAIENDLDTHIATELAKRGQLNPEFANSVEECTDTSKLYVLPDGYIYAYIANEYDCKNWIPYSTDSDGSIYNSVGYKVGCRINSSGEIKEGETQYALTGFIPCAFGEEAHISADVFAGNPGSCAIHGFDENRVFKAYDYTNNSNGALTTEADGTYTFNAYNATSGRSAWQDVKFIRVTGVAAMNSSSIITVNEKIGDRPDNNGVSNSSNVLDTVGWKENTRLSASSSYAEKENTGTDLTGYIAVKAGDIIRLKNVTMPQNDTSYSNKVYYFDGSKVGKGDTSIKPPNFASVADSAGNIIQFKIDSKWTTDGTGFIRIGAVNIDDTSVITINKEIVDGEEETNQDLIRSWRSTGHAFVPADYENRIIASEETVKNHEVRLKQLESMDDMGVPNYVKVAAEEVIDKVMEAQGNRTFTFAAVSDLHFENGNYTDGILHMSQALSHIGSRIKLDAFVVLGDYVSSFPSTDYADSMDDFEDVNNLLNEMRFAPNLRVQGNHDFVGAKSPVVYRYVQSFSDDVVWGDRLGGYYFRDFADYKLRVIALNMMEANNGNGGVWSTKQMNWLIDSLNLSEKSDAPEWQILIISHHPLDWYYADYASGDNVTVVIPYILEAYRTGTSWSHNRLNVSCNFSGKNAAKLIGNIHGHIHNYMVDNLYLDNSNSIKSGVKRIATPEACIERANNTYIGSIWEDNTTYAKTKLTVEDTAFCVYVLDLDSNTMHAIHYGAGIDREIAY